MPSKFRADPRFYFQGPDVANVFAQSTADEPMENGLNALIDAMTPESSPRNNVGMEENEERLRRSTRKSVQPQLYQSDEVECQERNAKH